MRSPEDQSAGETRDDPHAAIARQQWEELRESEKRDASIGNQHTKRRLDVVIRPELFGGNSDDTAAEAPIAPVENS